ncbi:MAG: circadian clock KaiB family protein, partial [Prochlorothrix sp.]
PGESATVLDRAHGGPLGGEMEERDLVTEIDRSYVLRLFVAGHGSSTLTILQHLYSLLEAHVTVPYTLRVVDIVKYPDQAEINQVKAVPTLIRVWPEPTYRVVGYFERWDQLAQLFD